MAGKKFQLKVTDLLADFFVRERSIRLMEITNSFKRHLPRYQSKMENIHIKYIYLFRISRLLL